MTRPAFAVLNTEFHGVPAGIKLVVKDNYTNVQGDEILIVERLDGKLLPTLAGPYYRTHIAAEFVTLES